MNSCSTRAVLIAACCLLASCTATITNGPLDRLDWLLGEWKADDGKTVTVEKWHRASAFTYEGVGESQPVNPIRPPSRESLRLVEMAGEIFYLAKVSENELPVAFKLVECAPGVAVFENENHDFPRKIEYTLLSETSLRVVVSGGASNGFQIEFEKHPAP